MLFYLNGLVVLILKLQQVHNLIKGTVGYLRHCEKDMAESSLWFP